MDTSHRYAYARQGERSGKSLTRSRQGESGPSDFALLLIAVAAAGASQTGVLAFLPDLVREGLGESTVDSQGFHTAGLAAAHPVGALLLAPLWGWLADRYDYRILLRTTLVILALATTATGATPLAWLYVLRALAGACSAAIIPLALLAASLGAGDRGTQARRFTWLTAFVFLGDMLGPLFGELSTRFLPTLPLAMVALIVGLTAGLMLFACLPPRSTGYRAEACGNRPTPAGALGLLTLTLLGTSGLAVLHMVLLVPGSQLILSREHVAGMLALCGFAMLAAQLFHVYFPWLIASPRALAFLMLTLLSTSLVSDGKEPGRNCGSCCNGRLGRRQPAAVNQPLDRWRRNTFRSEARSAAIGYQPGTGTGTARRRRHQRGQAVCHRLGTGPVFAHDDTRPFTTLARTRCPILQLSSPLILGESVGNARHGLASAGRSGSPRYGEV